MKSFDLLATSIFLTVTTAVALVPLVNPVNVTVPAPLVRITLPAFNGGWSPLDKCIEYLSSSNVSKKQLPIPLVPPVIADDWIVNVLLLIVKPLIV